MSEKWSLHSNRISTQLYLGFALPAIAILGIGAFSLYSFAQIDNHVASIYDDRVIPLQQLKLISDDYAVAVIDAVNKAHAGLISPRSSLDQIQRASTRIDNHWNAYLQTKLTPREVELVEETELLFDRADAIIEQLQQDLFTGNADLSVYDGQLYEVIDPLTAKIQELIDLQLEIAQSERQDASQIYHRTRAIFLGLLGAALLGASPLGYFFSRFITSTLKDTINKVAQATLEIATATEEHERIASQQAASVHETTTTMDQLNAFAQTTAQQAETVASESQASLNLTESGARALQQTLTSITTMKDKVEVINQQISTLSEQTNQIGLISSLVSDLANQTNMLALNAAVEAVRAGDQGKGFTVVATEIRKLADQSKQSSDRINLLVSDIQKAITLTVKATAEGTQTVDRSVEGAHVSAEAFEQVSSATQRVALSGQQIALSAEQQVSAIRQVLDAMHALNQAAAETTDSLGQTKIGTQQLTQTMNSLKALV